MTRRVLTGFAPVAAPTARVLVLGSFPGAASLARGEYYAHPRNQFWPIMAQLVGVPLCELPYARRLAAVVDAGIAIWDVHERCERRGSLDSSIRRARPNLLAQLVDGLPQLRAVAFNGRAAYARAGELTDTRLVLLPMPSTSPAYAMMSLDQKLAAWRMLEAYLAPPR